MKLAVLTKPAFFVEEDKILVSFFNEGLTNLHLFKPGQSPLYSERLLTLLPQEVHRRITVHQNYYLQREFQLAGVHLDEEHAPLPPGYKGKVGGTCGDLSQLKAMKKQYSYVFLNRVMASRDGKPCMMISELTAAAKSGLIDKHVWAMGGVTPNHFNLLRSLGFGGVVIGSDIWDRFDIQTEKDFRTLIDYFVKIRKALE